MSRPASGVFVTGTDTAVGKTLVACALLEALAESGLETGAYKPVAAGARETGTGLVNDDAEQLRDRATLRTDYAAVNPVTLAPAIAPHIAALQAGTEIAVGKLEQGFRDLARQAEFVVVEGAGGWLVPLGPSHTMADLAARIDLPVLLVVGLRLGCLNHALLTVASVRERGLTLAGWVANRLQPDMPCVDENVATLEARIEAPLLGQIPWLGDCPEALRPSRASVALDTRRLLRRDSATY